jgi:hypothetical protein
VVARPGAGGLRGRFRLDGGARGRRRGHGYALCGALTVLYTPAMLLLVIYEAHEL